MGAFRFSDIDRNIIVASTNMPDVEKSAMLVSSGSSVQRNHYSKSETGVDVYGSDNVYIDKVVTNEKVQLLVSTFVIRP